MNDLSGKCVNVVLAIEVGRGMGFIQHPIKIIANFNGRPLESDPIEPCDNPVFNTELVWETEKKEMRKIRGTNAPLRAEIISIGSQQRKDKVGFILLSPRTASIIPFESKMEPPFKWQKLLGVSYERKNNRPELYLSLTIRDVAKLATELSIAEIALEDQAEAVVEAPFEKDGKVIPINYLPDGYIEIGEGHNKKYLLTVIIQVAYNLDLLLPEVLVFNQTREKYFLSCKMFGIAIKTKPFCRDLHANIPMNEKIVIRILSKYEILKAYLSHHCDITVGFYCGRDKLGITSMNPQDILKNIDEEEFLNKGCVVTSEQKCFFKFPSPHGIIPMCIGNRQPFVETEITLKGVESQPQVDNVFNIPSIDSVKAPNIDIMMSSNVGLACGSEFVLSEVEEKSSDSETGEAEKKGSFYHGEPSETYIKLSPYGNYNNREQQQEEIVTSREGKSKEVSPREDGDANNSTVVEDGKQEEECRLISGCGDQIDLNVLELNDLPCKKSNKKAQSLHNLTERSESALETCRSEESVLKNVPALSPVARIRNVEDLCKEINLYQQYCLDVMLENIMLKKQIKCNKIYIKFKHPKAASVTTIVAEIYDHIGEYIILENSRCKMFFVSTPEHIRKMVYSWPPKLVIHDESDQPLTEELDIYTAMFLGKNRTECSYITECKAVRTYEPLAKISVMMYLQEYGLSALPQPTDYDLLPPILDEHIAVKELQDLQKWKDIQKVEFSADLKILEKHRLSKLRKEWSIKKKRLEEKLNRSVTRCEKLSLELQAAIDTIRTKKELEKKETELSGQSNCSFQDVVDKNTMKYADNKKMELIVTISKLERENENLKQIVNDQRHEIQQIRKTALTKEQTTNLLQQLRGLEEKFEEAQKAKTYFKDQWKRAVREIHDLRSEDQKQMQEKIQNQKNELSQLSLDNFLSDTGMSSFNQNTFTLNSAGSMFGAFKWNPTNFQSDTTSGISTNFNDET